MINMTMNAMNKLDLDFSMAFKSLFVTNNLDGSEDNWLFDVSGGDQAGQDEGDWLRADVTSPTSAVALKKKSLVNKLDDIAKSE